MLKAHHRAWLEKHPERSEGWLLQKLGEGFDVHHLDHCHHNNDPANVVLIEHADHMGLHNRVPLRLAKDDPARADLARRAYDMKEPSLSWADVEESVGIVNEKGRHGYAAHIEARRHAFIHGLPWPKPGASVVGGSNKRYQRPPNTTKGQAWRLQNPCTIPNPGIQQLANRRTTMNEMIKERLDELQVGADAVQKAQSEYFREPSTAKREAMIDAMLRLCSNTALYIPTIRNLCEVEAEVLAPLRRMA